MKSANGYFHSIRILKSLQHPTGLFSASSLAVKTGYNRAWIRDNIYEALGLEAVKSYEEVVKAYNALFNVLLKHEAKIDAAIREKPQHKDQYIHARYDPITLNEIWEEWGNKQNDTIGAFLFKVADLHSKGISVIRDENDRKILHKLVLYLASIRYWEDCDNGMWEENEEVHASSVGACLAGLKAISKIVFVPPELIEKGQEALNLLLPKESETKECDLALLSLIYPYNIVTSEQRELILKNVEEKLVRARGVIRYVGDQYYNKNGEAEWCFGFPWLAIIYKRIGNESRYKYYVDKTVSVMNAEGELPELYFANSSEHNENSPLGWAQAMYLVMQSE